MMSQLQKYFKSYAKDGCGTQLVTLRVVGIMNPVEVAVPSVPETTDAEIVEQAMLIIAERKHNDCEVIGSREVIAKEFEDE